MSTYTNKYRSPFSEKTPEVSRAVPSVHAIGHVHQDVEHYRQLRLREYCLDFAKGFNHLELEFVYNITIL